ncbi:YchJ family protein [Actinoalloteichus hymeniacidonis]|uniref:UPF0225 protein TL08_14685 n=1 Tax=Actinoalloteichus hymeniacidonis TaxID=340345 RepID=A0AAC9HR85_9PSEU|nr:YchJ family metal-binding protein [Actinoalloteichus hymeniacidonis]AOS63746.1 hypothetical protein TL08_14685 [Actinoalloteichus hymeniacidonis]
MSDRCPCGLGEAFADCCAPLHEGRRRAATAEQLMRSRYSAFAVGDTEYLLASWHPTTRPRELSLDPRQSWIRLDILGRTGGTPFDTEATVHFRARYRLDGERGSLTENSRFTRVDKVWLYVDGDVE